MTYNVFGGTLNSTLLLLLLLWLLKMCFLLLKMCFLSQVLGIDKTTYTVLLPLYYFDNYYVITVKLLILVVRFITLFWCLHFGIFACWTK